MPSRFLDELPESNVEIEENHSAYGGYSGFSDSRFDQLDPFANTYSTPGWQRAQRSRASGEATRHDPRIIEGELVAREDGPSADYDVGERVFHQKFGYGSISAIDGNKLTIDFDKAGQKRVLDNYVEKKNPK